MIWWNKGIDNTPKLFPCLSRSFEWKFGFCVQHVGRSRFDESSHRPLWSSQWKWAQPSSNQPESQHKQITPPNRTGLLYLATKSFSANFTINGDFWNANEELTEFCRHCARTGCLSGPNWATLRWIRHSPHQDRGISLVAKPKNCNGSQVRGCDNVNEKCLSDKIFGLQKRKWS